MSLMEKRFVVWGLWLLFVFSVLAFAVPLGIYISVFASTGLSDNPTNWGVFGDFVGGSINPVLQLLNLWVVVYIAFVLNRLETAREHALARPLLRLCVGAYLNHLYVELHNVGLGPAIITDSICYLRNNKKETAGDIISLWPHDPIIWTDFQQGVLAEMPGKDERVTLLRLEDNDNYADFEKLRKQVSEWLSDVVVRVKYNDMFGNTMKPLQRSSEIFKD
jgi:hypothetical protein